MRTATSGARSVLIIDDDEDVREAIAEAIHTTGRTVFEASGGTEALALLETIPLPCLILLDLSMPRPNGIEVLELIRRHPRFDQVTVVLITAAGQQAIEYSKRLPGVTETLPKPFELAELFRLLERHCIVAESVRH